jgi:hypothetical protein
LTLGGAPLAAHSVVDLPGYYWPDLGTPVGLPGTPTEEQAKAAAADKGCDLELIDITDKDIKTYHDRVAEFRGPDAMKALALAIQAGGSEAEIAREQAATAGKDE